MLQRHSPHCDSQISAMSNVVSPASACAIMSDTMLSVPPSGRPHAALLVCHMPLRIRQILSEEPEGSMGLDTARSAVQRRAGKNEKWQAYTLMRGFSLTAK